MTFPDSCAANFFENTKVFSFCDDIYYREIVPRTCSKRGSVRIFGKILTMTRQKSAGILVYVKNF